MRKNDDKPAAFDHVLYEVEMLVHALLLLGLRDMASDWKDRSGWIEVFAIHARNLDEFFAKDKRRGGYMKPDHFVAWTYSYKSDSDLVRRASSKVAHLTYDRERPQEKTSWPLKPHFKTMRDQSLTFLRAAASVEPLMAYHENRARTLQLLDLLPRLQFEDDAP